MACRVGSGEITAGDLYTEGGEEENITDERDDCMIKGKKFRCSCLSNAMLVVGCCYCMLTFRSSLVEATSKVVLRGRT